MGAQIVGSDIKTNHEQTKQERILQKGEEILKAMDQNSKSSLFSKDFWYGSVMDWSMKNESFKTNMFRFVDVLPALKSGQDVAKHLKEYFAEKNDELPGIFNVGLGLGSLAPGIMATAIRKNVEQMAKMFITGETPADAVAALNKARKNKICFTVDILGEATLSESEAEQYQQKYLNLIGQLATESSRWDAIPQIDQDHYGPIPKVNVSVKLSALSSMINSTAWEETKNVLKVRLRPILRKAMETNTALSLDMEHYGVKNLTLEVFREILLEEEFKSYPHFGCVIQAYLRDSQLDLQELVAFSKKRGTPVNIRLVKGAYWDSETIEAKQKSWPTPVFLVKAESDANFEACAEFLLDHIQYVRPQFASHNVRTIAAAIVYAEQAGIPKNAFEIQMLFGMGDPIKKALVQMGFRVREYAPVGDLLPGMAYLVRRLLENTSNESWLRGKFAEGKSTSDLLKDPRQGLIPTTGDFQVPAGEFVNEAFVDFSIESNRRKMLQAIAQWESQLPLKIPIRIRNQMMDGKVTSPRPNPSQTLQCVSLSQLATTTQAQSAIDAAKAYFPVWKSKSPDERANILEKAADLMTAKKFQLASLQVLEVGKPWGEADADVAEAIDFCRYYAQQVRRMSKPQLAGKVPGELSLYQYRPRGVTAVIAPWNFPFAIICGMTAAALATGNTVVMKPAEQSPASAWELAKILVEAGVPTDALQFLPGVGEEIGDYLVRSPDIHTIAFTGSRSVGLQILRSANEVSHSQHHIKKCIIEMGGKNAIVIDSDADLDEAVEGVLNSAFGFAGQKCSAASRVIVLAEVYEKFTQRLKDAAASWVCGSSLNPTTDYGPVVDQDAMMRILDVISDAEKKHQLLFKGQNVHGGYYIPATIFTNVQSQDSIAQEEIFGPVLAVLVAKDFPEALKIANSTQYALTGGLYSRSPANIQFAKENFEVGNLYINRGITGAMVNRHPFGGFKMSGVGSKTGGPDYLLQFVEPVCVTENTMRRGFAPQS